jgi:NADPH:quinone reductase
VGHPRWPSAAWTIDWLWLQCVGDIPLTFRPLLFNSIGLKFFLVYDLLPADRTWCVNRTNELLASGQLKHTIGAHFSLDQIVQAHEAVEAGQLGNVVIDL